MKTNKQYKALIEGITSGDVYSFIQNLIDREQITACDPDTIRDGVLDFEFVDMVELNTVIHAFSQETKAGNIKIWHLVTNDDRAFHNPHLPETLSRMI